MEVVSNQTFDLIVSNIPAKIGDEAIAEDFIQTIKHLNSGGELWVVVVNKLNRLIPKLGGPIHPESQRPHSVSNYSINLKSPLTYHSINCFINTC